MYQIRKKAYVMLGFVATIAFEAAANAETVKAWTDFDYQYNMSTDPTADGAFYLGGGSTLTTDSGKQVADMTGFFGDDADGGSVWQGHFSDNPGYTIEVGLKVKSMVPGKRGAWAISASALQSNWATKIYIGDSSIKYEDQNLGLQTVSTASNTDAYHVFRASFSTVTGGINIWRDGTKVADLVTPKGSTASDKNVLYLGAAWTGVVAGETLVDYIAITPGEFAPVPEPSSIVMLFLALAGLLTYGWRAMK